MKQSPENWRELGYGQPPAQGSPVHQWWDDWYRNALTAQEVTNAMPGVFAPLTAGREPQPRHNPFNVTVDPATVAAKVQGTPFAPTPGLSQDVLTLLAQIPQDQLLLLLQNFVAGRGGGSTVDTSGSPTG